MGAKQAVTLAGSTSSTLAGEGHRNNVGGGMGGVRRVSRCERCQGDARVERGMRMRMRPDWEGGREREGGRGREAERERETPCDADLVGVHKGLLSLSMSRALTPSPKSGRRHIRVATRYSDAST
jgi:hypothetical protein